MKDFNEIFSDAQTLADGDSQFTIHTNQIADPGKAGNIICIEINIGKGTGTATSALQVTLSSGLLDDGSDMAPVVAWWIAPEKVTVGGTVLVGFLATGIMPYQKLTYAGGAGVTGATVSACYAIHGGQTNQMA